MPTKPDPFAQTESRVYVTEPDEPESGRTFVWSFARWYEREEGASGDVAFSHVADSDTDLHAWLWQEEGTELTELDEEYARTVIEEFESRSQLYPEAPELSDEEPFSEQYVDVESDDVHYHWQEG
ncbi:MAG: hypothetical protein ACOC5M_02375 [Chloroflexota bacterium]